MFQFPFGTMHQLNLDWFLQQWQQLRQEWIDEEQHIEDSMQDVYDARDAAIQAKDDAVAAKNDAESAQAGVHADALMAEGYAVGEQNGTPVGPGDPYYQSNAKFYSIEAGTYRYLSEAYARGTMGGTPVDPGDAGYEDNAKYYKDAADLDAQSASADAGFAAADALKAEGYAVGEQNGTPVSSGDPYYQDNAKYYAGEAQQDKEDADTFKAAAQTAALKSEGFAVGEQNGTPVSSGSPYYQNNAEYYANMAAGYANLIYNEIVESVAVFLDGANNIPLKKLIAKVEPYQEGSGTPSPDNIRTIHGYDYQNIWSSNMNMFDPDNFELLTMDYQTPAIQRYGHVFTQPGKYAVDAASAQGYVYGRVKKTDGTWTNEYYIATPGSHTAYVINLQPGEKLYIFDVQTHTQAQAQTIFNDKKIFAAYRDTQPDSITEFVGSLNTIDLYSLAGTVFGAEVDPLNGKLYVTDLEIASYNGESLPSTWISDRDEYDPNNPPSTGAQVVYKLAVPVEYTFTPISISSLYGYNTIWNDTGETDVEYYADTKLYIDTRIAALEALVLENI